MLAWATGWGEQRIAAQKNTFVLRSQGRLHVAFALEGMRISEQNKQEYCHRKPVGKTVWHGISYDNLRRRIVWLDSDVCVAAIWCHVIVIADQYLASHGVNKDISVGHVLAGVACMMQNAIGRNDLQRGICDCPKGLKTYAAQHEVGKSVIMMRE